MIKRVALLSLAFLVVGTQFVHAASLGLPDVPAGYVTDNANLLTAEEKLSLEARLSVFAASTSIEIAVVTVPSLQGDYIEHAATQLFEDWKIGDAEKDTGVLLLVVSEDREARIEVGYGLEGALTDSKAAAILNNTLFPAFKEGKFGDGIAQSADIIMSVTQGEALPYEETPSADLGSFIPYVLFIGFVILQALVAILQRSKSWWLGGVLGFLAGAAVTVLSVFGISLLLGGILTAFLTLSGLALDYVVSKGYVPGKRGSGGTWGGPFLGGGGFGGGSSGGGFGGFGGGSSGGGGASGRW